MDILQNGRIDGCAAVTRPPNTHKTCLDYSQRLFLPIGVENIFEKKILMIDFLMTAFPMTDQEIRELSCEGHEGKPFAQCLEQKVTVVCKHCGKVMGETDDPKWFDIASKKLRGNY